MCIRCIFNLEYLHLVTYQENNANKNPKSICETLKYICSISITRFSEIGFLQSLTNQLQVGEQANEIKENELTID